MMTNELKQYVDTELTRTGTMSDDLENDLRELIEQWREKPSLYREDMDMDVMHQTTREECAYELEGLLDE